MAGILEFLKSPLGMIVVLVALTLITGGKLDVNAILAMIQRVINPSAAATLAAEKKRISDREKVADEIEQFIADGDTEGEALARKRLDRLIRRGK